MADPQASGQDSAETQTMSREGAKIETINLCRFTVRPALAKTSR